MDACNCVCGDVFGADRIERIATHYYEACSESVTDKLKILCGTNILYCDMYRQQQWALPRDLHSYQNVCLLGVGLSDIGINRGGATRYSKYLYDALLSPNLIHSVRDEKAKRFLNDMGFNNVVNTACPTMWGLTKELQASISPNQASTVITSITDYAFDPVLDKRMLEVLRRCYDRVAIWIQGSHDLDWCLEKTIDLAEFDLIGPDVSELDSFLDSGNVDYIGTRLHAGIRALNHGVRSLIIAVDNRARQIAQDTNLPVIERNAVDDQLERWIRSPFHCEIKLPFEAINTWKSQFQGMSIA